MPLKRIARLALLIALAAAAVVILALALEKQSLEARYGELAARIQHPYAGMYVPVVRGPSLWETIVADLAEESDVRVFGVSRDSLEATRAYVEDHRLSFPVVSFTEPRIRVHRIGTEFQWQTALTDSDGAVTFPDLLPGQYRLAGYRALSEEEAAELGDRRRAFGDGRMIHFGGASTATLRLAPDERGSLVIGEVYGTCPKVNEVDWEDHEYLEVYNNSDTTIYLDGKILGLGIVWWLWDGDAWQCDLTALFRSDPDGVWSHYFYRFPGSGTDHSLAPGEVAVVARDAIDHSLIHPSFPDLSQADFELFGSSDVDNPGVPNMSEIGVKAYWDGHGTRLWVRYTYFLSEPVDVASLPHAWDEWGNVAHEIVRFPREALLDVLATAENGAYYEQVTPPCDGIVHRDFDRLAGGFIKHQDDLEYSVQRLVIDTTPDGRAILQDTNTSAVDLVRALYTVGTLPGNGGQ